MEYLDKPMLNVAVESPKEDKTEEQEMTESHEDIATQLPSIPGGGGGDMEDTLTIVTHARHSTFQDWMKNVNGGKKTTLEQQFQLALDLYQQAYPHTDQLQTAEEVIRMVQNTPIHDTNSIVSWTGIKVDWFLDVFCQSPFMKVLIEYGSEVWFIRKICVIEMVRQTAVSRTGGQPNGTFVENIHSVCKGWDLEGGQDITAKPTTFISYTGAYTMDHVAKVLTNLDHQDYVWMDIFCVNQFAWTGKGRTPEMRQFRDTFMDDLQNQIKAIGNTALILEKWDNVMLTLGQMWVLWEIFNTAQAKVDLKVLLTQEQRDSFIANCLESTEEFKTIQSSLATINANDAVTDDDIDRQFILERMKRDDHDLIQVNTAVLDRMRVWLAVEGLEYLSKIRGNGKQPSCLMLNNLGSLLQDQGRLDEAEPLLREALESIRQLLGDHHPDTLTSINNMGTLMKDQGRLDEAERLYREALETRRKVLGNRGLGTLICIGNLGSLLKARGRLDEAKPLYREALEAHRQLLGKRHSDTLRSINNMGALLQDQGRLDEAEPLYREALETRREVLGDRHPDTLQSINNMGLLLQNQGRLDEAEMFHREALQISRQVHGNRHPHTHSIINNLGLLLKDQGRLDEAEPLLREAMETSRQVLGDRHQDTLTAIHNMGSLLKDKGRLDEAEPLLREALETMRQVLGDRHPNTLASINTMGSLLYQQDRLDEAEPLFREDLETSRQVLGDRHPHTLISINNMGYLLQVQNRNYEAEPLYREALETMRQVLGTQNPDTLSSINNLGTLLQAQGKLDEAEPLYREALETRRLVLGDRHPDTLTSIDDMISLLKDQGRLDEAEPLCREALETKQQVLGNRNQATLKSMYNLAALFLEQEGKPHLQEASSLLRVAVSHSVETLGLDHDFTGNCLLLAMQIEV